MHTADPSSSSTADTNAGLVDLAPVGVPAGDPGDPVVQADHEPLGMDHDEPLLLRLVEQAVGGPLHRGVPARRRGTRGPPATGRRRRSRDAGRWTSADRGDAVDRDIDPLDRRDRSSRARTRGSARSPPWWRTVAATVVGVGSRANLHRTPQWSLRTSSPPTRQGRHGARRSTLGEGHDPSVQSRCGINARSSGAAS